MNKNNLKAILKSNEIISLNDEILEHIKAIERINNQIDDISSILKTSLKVGDKRKYERLYFKLVGDTKLQYSKIGYKQNRIDVLKFEVELLSEI